MWGIIALVLCVLLLLKAISGKLKINAAERVFDKIDIPCSILLIVVIVIHCITTIKVWDTRNVMVLVSGFLAAGMIIVLTAGYFLKARLRDRWNLLDRRGALLMVLLVAGHIALFAADFASYKKSISAIEIAGMDADRLKDGVYEGEYDAGYIYAKVSVVVENGRIRDIKILKHDNERGKAAEAIIERIIEQQSTRVDAVTGATNSSLVIMKAIENALGKGK